MNVRWLGFAALILGFASSAPPARAQATWHVDVAGVPPGTGSPADPYTSLQFAITRPTTVSGDTLLVEPGTYVEDVHYSGKRLTIRSTGGPLVTTLRPVAAPQVVLISQLASGYSELEGFTITGYSSSAPTITGVRSYSGVIRRCILYSENGTGRAVYVAWDVFVSNSTIVGNTEGMSGQEGGLAWIEESIFWANSVPLRLTGHGAGPSYDVTYCAGGPFDNAMFTLGNVEGDPGLWYLPARDVHLRPGSVCIDAGNPASPADPDGTPRDIGALAFDPAYATPPTAYCTAKANSLGCVPAIGATGTASAGGGPFVVTAANELNQRAGLLFYGLQPKGSPFQGGWLCVQSPVKRTGLLDSGGSAVGIDCSGAYAFDFGAHLQLGLDPWLVPGAVVFGQFWSRDPADPTGFGSNRTDGLRFGIAP